MANMNVSYQELNDSAGRLTAGREEINSTLARLQAQISSLVSAGFITDRTSPAYTQAYNRFTAGAQATVGGLEDLAMFLRAAAQTLQEVDIQLAARLTR